MCKSGSSDEDPGNAIIFEIVREVSLGAEIYNTYGRLCNELLLNSYGFVFLNQDVCSVGSHNSVSISLIDIVGAARLVLKEELDDRSLRRAMRMAISSNLIEGEDVVLKYFLSRGDLTQFYSGELIADENKFYLKVDRKCPFELKFLRLLHILTTHEDIIEYLTDDDDMDENEYDEDNDDTLNEDMSCTPNGKNACQGVNEDSDDSDDEDDNDSVFDDDSRTDFETQKVLSTLLSTLSVKAVQIALHCIKHRIRILTSQENLMFDPNEFAERDQDSFRIAKKEFDIHFKGNKLVSNNVSNKECIKLYNEYQTRILAYACRCDEWKILIFSEKFLRKLIDAKGSRRI